MAKPDYVVENIMEAILTNNEFIALPKFCYVFPVLHEVSRTFFFISETTVFRVLEKQVFVFGVLAFRKTVSED